ncbi:hypothetical protein PRIPAC_81060 [Pristionchus pacificus]|uniref:Cytochrome P450 n=1 Tax=Pristionchus pacificus TaxID=54126 RepID=A0A2A6BVR7_PRIPA|nr:hypothetical protein PRIPAC_81060 [Pristionchus pacificus]|eukprot:PDM69958.1 cytochrome P450 [Pristionchus pacificus]
MYLVYRWLIATDYSSLTILSRGALIYVHFFSKCTVSSSLLTIAFLLISSAMLFLLGLATSLLYALYRYYSMVARYPRGPFPWPLVGNMFQQDFARQHLTSIKFAPSFDGVFTLYAPVPIVFLTDYEAIREAFVERGDDFAGRPENIVMQEIFMYAPNSGVINSNGENWREQRRVALSILRDFGMGKNLMEEQVLSSVREYLEALDNIKNKDKVDLHWPIQLMVGNIINETLFGYRYKYDDCEKLINYVEDFQKWIGDLAKSPEIAVGFAAPALLKIPFVGYHCLYKHRDNMRKICQYIVDNVQRCMEGYKPDDEPSCFVHAYTQRMPNNAFLDDVNLISTCNDFFMAGQETTTTTLRWAVLYLALNQDAQEKLRREIHAVVGRDRLTRMADKNKMIYAQATVLEVQRMANIVGGNLTHRTTRDTVVKGHHIPKDTFINGDIHYVMARDPHFVDPERFNPDRFLNEDGTALRKDLVDRVVAFSLGKRACAGEGLARVELFLGLTATVQNYRILPRDGEPIDLEPLPMNILQPRDQYIKLEKV